MKIEFCVERVEEVVLAKKHKVERVELCSGLEIGGLTPSIGLQQQCVEVGGAEIHAMIRPRGGDFCYTEAEIQIMEKDIKGAKQAGASGVVFGILKQDLSIDKESILRLADLAKSLNLELTFHRAFDLVKQPMQELDTLMDVGFNRLLTAGQKETAHVGLQNILSYCKHVDGKLEIMAGHGIDANNIQFFAKKKIDAVHFSIGKTVESLNQSDFGGNSIPDEDKVIQMLNCLSR